MSQKQTQLLSPLNGNINVTGVVTASAFAGDGSSLTGLPAGLGTALSESGVLSNIYYTDQVLGIASTITIDPPSTAVVAYTQYADVQVTGDADLIIGDGDEFVTDILGIGTTSIRSSLGGNGGRILADNYASATGTGAPTFPNGVNITGVATATTFSGNATTATTATTATNAQGLTGTPNITVTDITSTNVTGVAATFSGNVTIGGTLTYQDVESIDSIGIVTAQQGVQILANGLNVVSGVATAPRLVEFNSLVATASSDKTTFAVTVAAKTADHRYFGSGSSSGYFLDGTQSPIVKLTPGKTYFFDQGDSSNSGHPLRFYLQSDRTNQITDGITSGSISPGTAGAGTTVVVDTTTPSVLYYMCSSHAFMGNAVTNDSSVVNTNYDTRFGGFLKESVEITAGKLSDNTNIDVTNGNMFLFTTTETTTATPNIRYDSGTTLNDKMDVGETVSLTIVTTAAAAGYAATVNIDGATVGTNSGTLNWTGGSAPSDGGSSGVDIYAYTIMKTAASKYTVIATQTKTS